MLWGADLSGSRLQGIDFNSAFMHRCCLRGVLAAGSHWHQARLVEADFRSGLDQLTDLGGADFQGADLRGACLYGADLRQADLQQADLRGCDLRDCNMEGSRLEGAQLEGALSRRDSCS